MIEVMETVGDALQIERRTVVMLDKVRLFYEWAGGARTCIVFVDGTHIYTQHDIRELRRMFERAVNISATEPLNV